MRKQPPAGRRAPPAASAPAPSRLRGELDDVDPSGLVSGWCASMDPPYGPRRVAVLLDGVAAARGAVCNLPRPDLQKAGFGDGRHGFAVTLPETALRPGAPCKVSLRDEASGEPVGRVVQVRWAERRSPLLEAAIDEVSADGIVTGWCWDRHDRNRTIQVEILLNGAVCGSTRADRPREDLGRAGKGNGRNGFAFALDTTQLALQPVHSVSLREAGGTMQVGAPVTWRWSQAVTVENRLATMERKVEALSGALRTRQPDREPERRDPKATPGAGKLRLRWISGEADTPGHIYRVERMAGTANALGHEARHLTAAEAHGHIDELREADALIIWRAPLTPELRIIVDAVRAAGGAILFDIDDLMLEPALARPDIIDAIRSERHDTAGVRRLYQGIREMALLSDAVLVTTPELGLFAQALQRPVHVVPNGFDAATVRRSRLALRHRAMAPADGLLRIGYAGGSRTHQRDFGLVAGPLARILAAHPHCRLVLFRSARHDRPLIDLHEYPALAQHADQIEWRGMVDLAALPDELARFDINLAPVEVGNVFCEAKSELKFFEAALVGVPTIASPTGPFRRAIRDGETGVLADGAAAWNAALDRLVLDLPLRRRLAQAAYHDALRLFGPERRGEALAGVLAQVAGGGEAARAFELGIRRAMAPPPALPHIPVHQVVHSADQGGEAEVSVIIPLYNYADFVGEALDSVWHQDVGPLDLIVIDDRSTDRSLAVVQDWVARNGARFNRVVILQNLVNSGLGLTRNAGFAVAETPFVLPLDADNRILPHCLGACLAAVQAAGAAYAYPSIRQFGDVEQVVGAEAYWPARLAGGNFIDAMALVSKAAWASVGGYDHVRFGWEDYDFWCRLAEHGFWGVPMREILAEYRVHGGSMLRRTTDVKANKLELTADLERRHPWVTVARVEAAAEAAKPPKPARRRRGGKKAAVRGSVALAHGRSDE